MELFTTKHSGLKSISLKLWAEDPENFINQQVVNGNNMPALLIQAVWKKFLKFVLPFLSYCNNINTWALNPGYCSATFPIRFYSHQGFLESTTLTQGENTYIHSQRLCLWSST